MSGGILHRLRRFGADSEGSAIIELALSIALFLLLFFGLIDFTRLGFTYVMGEKATERAVRLAIVNPGICEGMPRYNAVGYNEEADYGEDCNSAGGTCENVGSFTCTGSDDNDTAASIFAQVRPLLPTGATAENLEFTYSYDNDLGFLGGPFTPVVSVRIVDLTYNFITPLGVMAGVADGSGQDTGFAASFIFPGLSASLAAENIL